MRFGLICENPQRSESFKDALKKSGHPAPVHLTYSECLASGDMGAGRFEGLDILRFDSPGGSYATWSTLSEFAGFSTTNFQDEFGRIYPLSSFMIGFEKILRQITASTPVPTTVDPNAIFLFADKSRAHAWCKANGFPVPTVLPDITSCAELMARLNQLEMRRAFLKLRHGSAASGVLAIEKHGHHIRVITSVERKIIAGQNRLYNSLKMRKYLDDEARDLIDVILDQFEVHIEEWIPKLRLENNPTDFRVVMIGGEPAHIVVRCSETPITNLHLGNQRLSIESLGSLVPESTWQKIRDMGSEIAALHPKHFCFGLDIAIHRKTGEIFIIEINAFGDYLNHVKYKGMDPHSYQIKALEKIYAGR